MIIYDYDSAAGKLTEGGFGALKRGSGPRHLALTRDGKRAYVINELGSTLTSFNYDGNHKMTEIQTVSTLPQPTPGNSTAEFSSIPMANLFTGRIAATTASRSFPRMHLAI